MLPAPIPSTVEAAPGERRAEICRVDITADLNDEDQAGYLWTFLDEARDPAQIRPGALVVAGDEEAAAVCKVVDLVPAGDGTIVHLRLLPGLVDDYRALVDRALASYPLHRTAAPAPERPAALPGHCRLIMLQDQLDRSVSGRNGSSR